MGKIADEHYVTKIMIVEKRPGGTVSGRIDLNYDEVHSDAAKLTYTSNARF